MTEDAHYWHEKWKDAQKELMVLRQILKDEFERSDQREVGKLREKEKRYGKPRTK